MSGDHCTNIWLSTSLNYKPFPQRVENIELNFFVKPYHQNIELNCELWWIMGKLKVLGWNTNDASIG